MNEQEQLYDDDGNEMECDSTTSTEDLGDEPTLPGEDDFIETLLEPTRNYYYETQTICR